MTEIGAVKIQNGQVIDAERLIPPFITKLTGITNEMVANAPLFADVADSDAIFAAHNVNFGKLRLNLKYSQITQLITSEWKRRRW